MSSKEDFFRKVQENKDTQHESFKKTRSDIMSFQADLHALIKQIEMWIDGSGLQVITTENTFNDNTVSILPWGKDLQKYKATSCKLKNQNRTAVIVPVGVYGDHYKASISITIDNPNRAPREEKFILTLEDRNTWSIRRESLMRYSPSHKDEPSQLLDENIFFMAISGLA
ncbi:hypothetical protein [Dickeya undicola]|uniref:hypothetical protein n=1 Tax=Dickeya undicola TaxID=1577887 RepID=UPI000532EA75|nr:hypothetical protein [Dickeya undicola]